MCVPCKLPYFFFFLKKSWYFYFLSKRIWIHFHLSWSLICFKFYVEVIIDSREVAKELLHIFKILISVTLFYAICLLNIFESHHFHSLFFMTIHYIFSELLIKVSITRQWLLLILGAYYTVTFQDYQVSLHGLFKHWASLGTMRNLFTAAGSTKVKLIRGWHNWLIGKACHGEVVL